MSLCAVCVPIFKLIHSIGCSNKLVTVNVNSTASTLTCIFQNNESSIEKTCSVKYEDCNREQASKYTEENSTLEFPDRVILQIILPSGSDCYTYTVTTYDGANNTVAVEGRVDFGR